METCLNRTKSLIIIPYAEVVGFNSGVNISNQRERREIYLKNCCVACLSARKNNDEYTDVALVTNIDVPEKYKAMLADSRVEIIKEEFDLFNFGDGYVWSLAFYKLCALYRITRGTDYCNYAYLDSDVYVQNSFNDIWSECGESIMLYDINHGLQVDHYRHFLQEVNKYLELNTKITHFGGEFFAANKNDSLVFSQQCLKVFNDMKEKRFVTTHGDEFIVSIVANQLKNKIKNAGAYVFRFWTGYFRLVSTCYEANEVVVIHVPDEKESAMIYLFDKYISKNKDLSKSQLHKLLHLKDRSVKVTIGLIKQKLLKH